MAATMGREEIFQRILIFFAVVTAITGILNMAGSGAISLGNFGSGTIPGQATGSSSTSGYIEGANTAAGTQTIGVDFTTAVSVNSNITTEIGGPWTLTAGEGLVLSSLPLLAGSLNPSAIIVRNGQSSGGVYTTNAKVDNPNGVDYYVFPRFINGYSGSDIKVVFSGDGVHVKKFPLLYGILDNGDDFYYPLPNAQQTSPGGSTITTRLTEVTSTQISNTPDYTSNLVVSKDGTELFSIPVRAISPGANINDQVRHGGAGSDDIDFTVMGFPNTPMLDTSSSIVSGFAPGLLDLIPGAKEAAGFLDLVGAILGLTANAYVPFWLWAIIAIPSISTLILISLEMARGN